MIGNTSIASISNLLFCNNKDMHVVCMLARLSSITVQRRRMLLLEAVRVVVAVAVHLLHLLFQLARLDWGLL